MRRNSFLCFLSSATMILLGCGKGIVEVSNDSYERRIVVSGLLLAGHPVADIHVSRNFRLDANLQKTPVLLPEADVLLIDEDEALSYSLTFVDSTIFDGRRFRLPRRRPRHSQGGYV